MTKDGFSMNKKVKNFSNHRGEVYVTFDGLSYSTKYTLYSNYKTGRPMTIREWIDLDGVLAGEYFTAAKNELKGNPWLEPALSCAYPRGNMHICRRGRCPKKLGGPDYWDIFRATCPYRSR